ncbi:MAG: hypothetical protein HQL83_00095 [Magnetococcales bacterium]|nr:hypothetical protein [Magnetococcales bacterium]
MNLVAYFTDHRDALWFTLGFGLLALEAGIFGFASGVLLFTGMGAVVTGLMIYTGVLTGATIPAIASFAIVSMVLAWLFWNVFHRSQIGASAPPPPVSDLVGLRFTLKQDISLTQSTTERYSGIDWKVVVDPSAEPGIMRQGTQVEVVSLDAGIFRVRPVAT